MALQSFARSMFNPTSYNFRTKINKNLKIERKLVQKLIFRRYEKKL